MCCLLSGSGVTLCASFVAVPAPSTCGYLTSEFQQSSDSIRRLLRGASVEREISGADEVHSYELALISGEYVRVIVGQQDIDVFVKAFGPDGRQLIEVRNLNAPAMPERVLLIAEVSGRYRLDVRSLGNETARGRYKIKVEELRTAIPADRSQVAAARVFAEAEALHVQGSGDARRKALGLYEEALTLFRAAGDRQGEADTLQFLSHINYSFGDPRKALDGLSKALTLYRELGDRYGETQTLQGAGLVSHASGESQKALEYYRDALSLQRAAGDQAGEAGTLNNLGGIFMRLDEHQKALDYYIQSLSIQRALGNERAEGVTLNNIGETYRTLGDHQRALEYYQRSLDLRRAAGDVRGQAATLNNIALAHSAQGDTQKALEYYELALPLRRAVADPYGEASTLHNIGHIYYKRGEHKKAHEFCTQALEIRQKVGDRRGQANTLLLLGSVAASADEAEKALEYYSRALPLSRVVADRTVEAATLFGLARIERNRGNLQEARSLIETSLTIVESLRSKIASRELRATYFASKQEYHEFNIDVLMQLHQSRPSEGYDSLAFEASERARARSLLETLVEADVDIRQGVDLALLEREEAAQLRLTTREKHRTQLLSGRHTETQLADAEEALTAALTGFEEVRAQIRSASPQYAALTQPQPLNMNEIQQKTLDPDTLLLEFSLGDQRSFLWAVTRTSISSHRLPKRSRIEASARAVYDLLTARNKYPPNEPPRERLARIRAASIQYRVAAAALTAMLFGEVTELASKKRLLIVSDGALQYIPFGALPAPRSSASANSVASYEPLVLAHEIVSLPSASVLAVLRREIALRKPAGRTLAIMADPVFSPEDPRLGLATADAGRRPDQTNGSQSVSAALRSANESGLRGLRRLRLSRKEADTIAALVPRTASLKALDFAANQSIATSAELGQYRMVHFATHGLLNSQHPDLSGVVLSLVDEQGRSQDGFLTLHEIYNLKLNADLVVLSACQTALGKEIRGEGLIGLTRGFMYAGAARVTASLWSVDDRATAELMKRFYQGMLVKGLTAAASLRTAQIAMWRQPGTRDPFFWGAFVVQGEWR